jgi:SAM-dependent methyltransferase
MVNRAFKACMRILTRTLECYAGNYRTGGLIGVLKLTFAMGLCAIGPVYSKIGFTKRYCPSCDWKGANFLLFLATGYVSFQVRCPRCQCSSRHRAHQFFYDNHLHLMEKSGRLLYFAPESNVEKIKRNKKLTVKTSNYGGNSADYDIDIMAIPFEDNSWDFIICHRVIEHIPDDRLGMRELYRVLKPSGTLVLSVPIDNTLSKTIDYGAPNPLENDHYYNYALDFSERIPTQFKTTKFTFSEVFSAQQFRELSLIEDYLFICEKV